MKAPRFAYARAESLPHALELLAEHGDDAVILAGGQSLMPTLNMRLSAPRLVIDINRIEALKGISIEGDKVRIGALTRHADVLASDIVAECLPLIAQALPHVGHVAIRNRGTFGGSVAFADPSAEMPACALALGATLVLESKSGGRREVAAEGYFKGLYETERRADEILVEAWLPKSGPGERAAFGELARRHGDFALAGVACRGRVENGAFRDLRLSYFGCADRPVLATGAMAAAEGGGTTEETFAAVDAALGGELNPISNFHGDGATRLHLARVLTRRVLTALTDGGGVV